MNRLLKIKLLILSLLFPVSFSVIGYLIGWYLNSHTLIIIFTLLGFVFGIALDIICHSRKLFTIVLFYTPIPLSIFMLAWWIADVFTSSNYSLLIGFIGLIIGLWLNRELVLPYQFFKIKKRILAIVYVVFSVSSLGFFMGIPFFNILLGILAGNYLSIRVMDNFRRSAFVSKSLKRGASFTAVVLFLMLLISALSIISDLPSSIHSVNKILNATLSTKQFYWLIVIVGILSVLIQYFITLFTAKTMFNFWIYNKLKPRN